MVSISGINKVELLKRLWENTQVASFFWGAPIAPPNFDENMAKEAVKGYIDYFAGRPIKTDISGDMADPKLYDRDAGEGKFEMVVQSLRN